MSQVQADYIKPGDSFIDFTTTTSTTTVAPTLEYFFLPTSGVLCPQDPCICGSIFIPIGAKYSLNGSFISINNNRYSLVHDNDAFLEKEQLFITTTTKLIPPQNSNNLLTNNIIINLGQDLNLINVIQVIVKIRETKKTIGQLILGSFDSATPINNINIQLIDTFNLANLTLQLEISSLCKNSKQVCCDRLPSSVSLTNVINNIYCTITTTLPPFCTNFNLPDSFYMTIKGYGILDGQQRYSLVTRSGNTWYTSGSFPCGANYYISMTCDANTQSFIYDGYVDCCEESTKTIISPTSTPYLFPESVSPLIISYTDCFCDLSCSTTTSTTTTTTDFPTTTPPPPPVPCEEASSFTINGYAFYRDNNSTVDIPGIGTLRTPCYGGHWCDRTNFIPQLITSTQTINAPQISLNNGTRGGDRTQTFSFSIDDASILKNGASVSLKCVSGFCHTGVTWVVLTAEINNQTVLLFNSCVLPNSVDSLDFKCEDCCDWDGNGFIQFRGDICDGLTKSAQFQKIADNLWECDTDIDCGDRLNMIVKCNGDVKFDPEADLNELCKQKWELINFNFPCMVNPRLTGNLLALCNCDLPPVFEFTADNTNGCDCCTPFIEWNFNWSGQLAGNPWTLNPNLSSVRIDVEDSADCGGSNPSTQTGQAIATIKVGNQNLNLDINFNGAGETEATGYESLNIYINGLQIGAASSPGGGRGCSPVAPSIIIQQPATQVLLANTTYILEFNFTTIDPRFHIDAFYEINLLFNGQPLPNPNP